MKAGTKPHFFLGGADLEMLTIRRLLEAHAPGAFTDKGLAWGAALSAYRDEMTAAIARGAVPVGVELTDDLAPDDPVRPHLRLVDHHGPLAGADRPTSLHQVFALLALPPTLWTREHDLVAANDRGHIAAMLALDPPATPAEIAAIRAADRAAQGVTPAEEADAKAAIVARATLAGGGLTVLTLGVDRSTAAADLMEPALGGPGYRNLLVVMPTKLGFYGVGDAVRALNGAFPGGWYGGALPERGFWGIGGPGRPDVDRVIDVLRPLVRTA